MTMEIATNWFNLRSCSVSEDGLSLHAEAGHFPTFFFKGRRVVSIEMAEKILKQKPYWLHEDRYGVMPQGYVTFDQACQIHKVRADDLQLWIEFDRVNALRLVIDDAKGFAVLSVDVHVVSETATGQRRSLNGYRTLGRGVSMARARKKEPVVGYAAKRGYKPDRIKQLLRDGLIRDFDTVGDVNRPRSIRYSVHTRFVDEMIKNLPDLKAFLKGETPRLGKSLRKQLEEYDSKALNPQIEEAPEDDSTLAVQAPEESHVEEGSVSSEELSEEIQCIQPANGIADILLRLHRQRQEQALYDQMIADGKTDEEIVSAFSHFLADSR